MNIVIIGTRENSVDIVVSDNTLCVSRKHTRIATVEGNRFLGKDL